MTCGLFTTNIDEQLSRKPETAASWCKAAQSISREESNKTFSEFLFCLCCRHSPRRSKQNQGAAGATGWLNSKILSSFYPRCWQKNLFRIQNTKKDPQNSPGQTQKTKRKWVFMCSHLSPISGINEKNIWEQFQRWNDSRSRLNASCVQGSPRLILQEKKTKTKLSQTPRAEAKTIIPNSPREMGRGGNEVRRRIWGDD